MIKIEKDIPVAAHRHKHDEFYKVFKNMVEGDSFALSATTPEEKRFARTVHATFCNYGKKHGWKVACRTVDGVMRNWRVS
jgi:hypothetical protein